MALRGVPGTIGVGIGPTGGRRNFSMVVPPYKPPPPPGPIPYHHPSATPDETQLGSLPGGIKGPVAQSILQGRQQIGLNYANSRLQQFGRAASALGALGGAGGAFQGFYNAADTASDPVHAFQALSGHFADAARAYGFADPRVFLHTILTQGVKSLHEVPPAAATTTAPPMSDMANQLGPGAAL